jgi:hypothetical protein
MALCSTVVRSTPVLVVLYYRCALSLINQPYYCTGSFWSECGSVAFTTYYSTGVQLTTTVL